MGPFPLLTKWGPFRPILAKNWPKVPLFKNVSTSRSLLTKFSPKMDQKGPKNFPLSGAKKVPFDLYLGQNGPKVPCSPNEVLFDLFSAKMDQKGPQNFSAEKGPFWPAFWSKLTKKDLRYPQNFSPTAKRDLRYTKNFLPSAKKVPKRPKNAESTTRGPFRPNIRN